MKVQLLRFPTVELNFSFKVEVNPFCRCSPARIYWTTTSQTSHIFITRFPSFNNRKLKTTKLSRLQSTVVSFTLRSTTGMSQSIGMTSWAQKVWLREKSQQRRWAGRQTSEKQIGKKTRSAQRVVAFVCCYTAQQPSQMRPTQKEEGLEEVVSQAATTESSTGSVGRQKGERAGGCNQVQATAEAGWPQVHYREDR